MMGVRRRRLLGAGARSLAAVCRLGALWEWSLCLVLSALAGRPVVGELVGSSVAAEIGCQSADSRTERRREHRCAALTERAAPGDSGHGCSGNGDESDRDAGREDDAGAAAVCAAIHEIPTVRHRSARTAPPAAPCASASTTKVVPISAGCLLPVTFTACVSAGMSAVT